MSCQKNRVDCYKWQKKEYFIEAKRKFPKLQDPISTWECTEAEEKTCPNFTPYPPRMTQEEFKAKEAEILKDVPQEFRSSLSQDAWERGHAYGYEEVISTLDDLVANLTGPLAAFEKRIRKEIGDNIVREFTLPPVK